MRSSPYVISAEIGREVDAARLLEVGELRDLLPVEQHLPADAPRAERRRLPVVLLEAHVVRGGVDAERRQALQVQVLHVGRRRLQDHLVLLVLVEAVRVLAVAAVGRPARRLHVGDLPRLRPQHAQERLRVHGARADLGVPRLVDEAAALRPVALRAKMMLLQRHARRAVPRPHVARARGASAASRSRWRADQLSVERLQRARGRRARRPRPRPGGWRKTSARKRRAPVGQDRARGRAAGRADEAVRGRVVAQLARPAARCRSRRSGRAAGRGRAASAARPPGSAPSSARSVPSSAARQHRQGQPVDRVLRLALLGEGVEQLGEVRQAQGRRRGRARRRGRPSAAARTRPAGAARRPAARTGRPAPR